jgi:hypothetical protein
MASRRGWGEAPNRGLIPWHTTGDTGFKARGVWIGTSPWTSTYPNDHKRKSGGGGAIP